MLTEKQISDNKETFIKLLAELKIEGADIAGLTAFLEESDFFTAPASTKYHCSYKGGLCEHSLHVYFNLIKLTDMFASTSYTEWKDVKEPGDEAEQVTVQKRNYSDDTLKIVALFHDISKTNFYESYVQNKKIYSDSGNRSDNMGKFTWVAEEGWKVKDATERFLGGGHEVNSFLILSKFIPLSLEEIIAIMNHHAGTDSASTSNNYDLSEIMNRYSLAVLLHMSDFLSTYITEKPEDISTDTSFQ